jgi:hypothetical protein
MMKNKQNNARPIRIDYLYHPDLHQKYTQVQQTFTARGLDTELWVFHGTPRTAVNSILENGFMVGGDQIPIKNGSVFGRGVYTAVGPDDPFVYGSGEVVILAQGMVGCKGDRDQAGYDSWTPTITSDWVIFRTVPNHSLCTCCNFLDDGKLT